MVFSSSAVFASVLQFAIKRKPRPVANAPPIISDSYPIHSVDDYIIDGDYPIDFSGEVRRTKMETYMALTPFMLIDAPEQESSLFNDAMRLWLRGGFPRSVLTKTEEASFVWRENFISTFLERDIPLRRMLKGASGMPLTI